MGWLERGGLVVRVLAAPLRVIAAAVGAALLALALGSLLLLALSRGWERERLTRAVAWVAARALERPVRIGALRGPLLPALEIEGLELGASAGEAAAGSAPLLSIDWLALELELGALARGELDLVALRAGGVRAALPFPADGAAPEPERPLAERLAALALPTPPMPTRIRRVELSALRLEFGAPTPADPSAALALSLEARELALPWRRETSARAELRARGQLELSGLADPLPRTSTLDFELALAGGRLALARAALSSPRGSAELRGAELELAGWLEGRGATGLEWEIGTLRAAAPELELALRGRGGAARIERLELEASAPDLALLAPSAAALGGSLALRARASGPFAAPEIELALEGPIALQGAALSGASSSRRGWLALALASHTRFPLGDAGPDLDGSLALRGLELPGVAIDELRAELGTAADRYALVLRASASRREWLRVEAELPRAATARELLAGPRDPAALARRLLGDARSRLALRTAELEVAQLRALLPEALRDLAGRAQLELSARAAPTGPALSGRFELRGAALLPGTPLDALRVELATAPQRYELTARASAEGRSWLSGSAALPRPLFAAALAGPFASLAGDLRRALLADPGARAELQSSELELAELRALLPEALRELGGRARLELSAQGAVPEPMFAGRFELRGAGRLRGAPLDALRVELATTPQSYELSARASDARRDWLSGSAALPRPVVAAALEGPRESLAEDLRRALLADPRARAELRSFDFDLALAKPYLPRQLQSLEGRADFELSAAGASPEPALAGWIEISGGRLRAPLLRQDFEPIRGRIELADSALVIQRFEVGSARGTAALGGRIELANLTPASAELELALDHFALSRNPLAVGDLSGRVALAGPVEALVLRGELAAEEVRVSVRDSEDPALREIRVLAADAEPEGPEQIVEAAAGTQDPLDRALAAARIDVALAVPPKTWLRGGGAELEVEGELRLHKEPDQPPVLLGSANTIRGRYELQRQRFRVRRGSVTFDGAPGLDPLVDVEAVHEVREVSVIARVTGRLSAPRPSFTSEPPLPQDDVLALLLFGRPASELGGAEAGSVQGLAMSVAAGVAFQELGGGELGSFLPVDTFDVGLGGDEGGPSLEVGKYLSDRLFVSIGQSVGRRAATRARAEFSLSKHWSVLTELSSDESSGADLEWSIEY